MTNANNASNGHTVRASTNYFKVEKEPFFFRDLDEASLHAAWENARANVGAIAVWRMPRIHGPWTLLAHVIGETMALREQEIP